MRPIIEKYGNNRKLSTQARIAVNMRDMGITTFKPGDLWGWKGIETTAEENILSLYGGHVAESDDNLRRH